MITENAMVVRLHISMWGARKKDADAGAAVAKDFDTDEESIVATKRLIAREVMRVLERSFRKMRMMHYENTLPWDDDGGRILTTANFEHYSAEARKIRGEAEATLNEFVAHLDEHKAEARRALGRLYRERDYPCAEEIKRRCGIEVSIEPVPMAGDFRVNLQGEEVERIRAEIEASTSKRFAEAMDDLYERLARVVGHFAEKLKDKDAIFRDSLVGNVAELVELLPKLNLTGNGKLEELRSEVKAKLCGYEPETLREDKRVRAQAAKEADAILAKMAGYTGK